MIIEKTFDLLKLRYRNILDQLTISDVRIGIYLTAVRLSDNSNGISATIIDDQPFCAKSNRDFGAFTPLKIIGQKVLDLLEIKRDSTLLLSLQLAVLNAISSKLISAENYTIAEEIDPIHFVDLNSGKTITVVGAFHSYIRKISETGNKLNVLELNEAALPPEYRKFYVPADEYKRVLPSSDIVIITGQTLVNKSIDDLLQAISPGTQVIVTGPSAGILPDILFENKVNIIGAVRITKPEVLFNIVSEGGTGYHLFEYCAQKICILK
ncbi:MAG: DUF364 domain-containing protein [Bacteroidales bacterium]|nr:DUF364 domain-containing protein [Bacteroidales bacterium]